MAPKKSVVNDTSGFLTKACNRVAWGAYERQRHTRQLQAGFPCYLVMCEVVDTSAAVRAVRGFNKNEVFEAGELLLLDGVYRLELKRRVNAIGLFI